jgi:hypothetical protein
LPPFQKKNHGITVLEANIETSYIIEREIKIAGTYMMILYWKRIYDDIPDIIRWERIHT